MNTNKSFTLEQLAEYLERPETQRPFARYREELLEPVPAFTTQEIARLIEIVKLDSPQYPKFSVSKLLIDLSWASSHLEGNTYTQLDTQVLIEYGKRNEDKPSEDAAMILNHKKAIGHMIENPVLNGKNVLAIHKTLADNGMAPDSRHFLEPGKCGVIRSHTPDDLLINGSSYLPPQVEDRPSGFMEKEFSRLLASANTLPDAINQSFFIMTRLPYLQPFYDANKRTSRICCNIPLVRDGLTPLSFVDFDKKRYLGGLIAFYELGDERLAKSSYLDAYLATAFRYQPLGEDAKFALSIKRDEQLAAARHYVLNGVREAEPVWLLNRRKKIAAKDAPCKSAPPPKEQSGPSIER